jgi:hypothetical protein
MFIQNSCLWPSYSGQIYNYSIYEINTSFSPNQFGNYIYAKFSNGMWIPVYVGEGDLRSRTSRSHHKWREILLKGATHVHAHLNTNYLTRKAEESGILAIHPVAYYPMGCNERIGG